VRAVSLGVGVIHFNDVFVSVVHRAAENSIHLSESQCGPLPVHTSIRRAGDTFGPAAEKMGFSRAISPKSAALSRQP
jgi:hypothetical protein